MSKNKYRNKLVIAINFKGKLDDIFAPKRFDSTAADFEKKLNLDKGMIFKGYWEKRKR